MTPQPASAVPQPLQALSQSVMAGHGQDAAAAGLRLRTESAALLADADLPSLDTWLRCAEHVLLGHQDDATALDALLQQLQAQVPAERLQQPLLATALHRCRAALELAEAPGATPSGWPELGPADRVRAHYNAALAFSRRDAHRVTARLLDRARQEAAAAPEDLTAQRSLAAMAHNLSADLQQAFEPGDEDAAAAMVQAATLAREAWGVAGGWLEIERADWQLAMCCATTGQGAAARQHAAACLAACQAHAADGADDFEFCFAWQAVALAAIASRQREAAQAARHEMATYAARLSGGDADYARACLDEIDAAYGRLTASVDHDVAGETVASMAGPEADLGSVTPPAAQGPH